MSMFFDRKDFTNYKKYTKKIHNKEIKENT